MVATTAALGLFAFPGKGQTKEQQLADENECYVWAKDQTGIDLKSVLEGENDDVDSERRVVDSGDHWPIRCPRSITSCLAAWA